VHARSISYPVHLLRLLIACCIIFIHEHECASQNSNRIFGHLSTENGLSSDKVEAVLQDRDGFYWIATQNGLNRYDGSSFQIFRHNANDSTSLTHNYCTALKEGKDGDIWVATYKGVSRFIKSKGYFQQVYLHHPAKNFEITNHIYNLAVDNDGNVWMAGNGLWKYTVQDNSISLIQKKASDPSLSKMQGLITQMVFDEKNNGLWHSTGFELNFYSADQNEFYNKLHNPFHWKIFDVADNAELTMDDQNRLWFRDDSTQSLSYFDSNLNQVIPTTKKVNYGIKQIRADKKNRLWIFYWLGRAEIYDPTTAVTDTGFFAFHHRRSMISERANSLFIDKENNYWISSDNGISIYNEENQYYKLHQVTARGKGSQKDPVKINALAQTEQDHLWIATNIGLYRYDLDAGQLRRVNINLPVNNITTLCSVGDVLWIGVHDQVFAMDTKREAIVKTIHLNPGIFFLRPGNQNDLWVGLWAGGLYRVDLKTDKAYHYKKDTTSSHSIKSRNLITGLPDNDHFWIGYNGGNGFSDLQISSGSFTHFHPQENDLSSSNAGTITVITKDQDGYLWLGTHGSGVFRFDPATKTYENYQQQQGLNSNYINSINADKSGNLWISTADGMNYFNPEKQNIRGLDMDLIFPDNDFAANGIYGLDDKLFFFCKNEFVEVDPDAYQPDHAFPQIVISHFKIFDKEVPVAGYKGVINLSHQENFFSFEYSTVKTLPFKVVNYAYRLSGFDKDWNVAGNLQHASYTNVPYGNYVFEVKATNDEGQWSDVLIGLPVHIKPAFWNTWWFITLCIIVIISSAYGFYQYRIQQLKKIFSLRTKISQDLHDDIGGSLSSINIYSSVAEKEVTDNPDKAKEFLQQINTNSRQVMENISDIVWANNADHMHETSLAGRIKNYGYDLLSQKNIECNYEIDAIAERKLSKPEARRSILLIIKEALNNMAKYSEATRAEIHVSVNAHHLLLDIADDGKGFDMDKGMQGNGLSHMRQRTELLGGNFNLQSTPGNGTKIHCRIPLTNISER